MGLSEMSAFGSKADMESPMSAFLRYMSVIGGKADIIQGCCYVRY